MTKTPINASIILTVFITCSMGETSVSPVDFAKLPLDEALRISNKTSGDYGGADYAKAALDSKRMDLIQACFMSGTTFDYVRRAIVDLPQSPYKDSLILMMLETKSWYWPSYERSGSYSVVIEIDQKPFGGFIKTWLPDRKFNKETTLELRKQLAAEIRAAMASVGNKESSVKFSNDSPIPRSGQIQEIKERSAIASQIKKPKRSEIHSSKDSSWQWKIITYLSGIIGIIIAAILIWRWGSKSTS